MLFVTLVRRGHWGQDRELLTRIPRLVFSAGLMAVGLYFAIDWLSWPLSSQAPLTMRAGTVAALVAVAMIVYFGAAFATGGADLGMIRRNLKRKAAKPAVTESAE